MACRCAKHHGFYKKLNGAVINCLKLQHEVQRYQVIQHILPKPSALVSVPPFRTTGQVRLITYLAQALTVRGWSGSPALTGLPPHHLSSCGITGPTTASTHWQNRVMVSSNSAAKPLSN